MSSFLSQIDTILTGLGDAATADEIATALQHYSKRDIQAVLAARASDEGGGAALTVTGDTGEVTDVATLNLAGATVTETAPGEAEAVVPLPVLSVTVDLTDAQILTLPTVPVQVLAAPAAGQTYVLVGGMMRLDQTAGIYTNKAGGAAIYVIQTTVGLESSCKVDLTGLMQGNHFSPIVPAIIEQDEGYFPQINSQEIGYGFAVLSDNSLGNLTGGNAANYLRVTILYMLLDV